MEKQPYVLTDLENLSHIQSPLKSTQRIKYTCFNVSKKYLVFGATSGGLYIFKREPCTFLQLIPSKDGALCQLVISPDESIIAYATTKGIVVLVEHNVDQRTNSARRLQVSNEHLGAEVTALQWNSKGDELYAGDNAGRVSLTSVSLFTTKNIFQTPSLQLMQLDSRIVQMSFLDDLLLVSTMTRCYICDTEKEQYKQVGQKLRDGEYGACFLSQSEVLSTAEVSEERSAPHVTASNQFDLLGVHESLPTRHRNLRVFCARPGSRLWEVQVDGTVLSTHQFRQALSVLPPAELVTNKPSPQKKRTNLQDSTKHSFNFAKLYMIANKFIFTFKSDGAIYVFDPDNAEVVLWNDDLKDIVDAQIFNETIYIWLASGEMHSLTLSPIEKCIMRLYFRKQYALCAELCSVNVNHLMQRIPSSRKLHFLVDLGEKIKELGVSELQEKIMPLITEISKFAIEKPKIQKLKSGIYRVGNTHHLIESDDEDSKSGLRVFRSLSGSRAKKSLERSRSLSSSPDSRRRRKSGPKRQSAHDLSRQTRSGSIHSLPDMATPKHILKNLPLNKEKNSMEHLPPQTHSNGHFKNGPQNFQSREQQYIPFDDLFNVPELPFSVLTSPETVAALKDLTQILSFKITSGTKSIREKWLALEGKVRSFSQETPPSPLDIRTPEYKEHTEQEPSDLDQDVVVRNGALVSQHQRKDKNATVKWSIPELDVKIIIDLCKQVKNSPSQDIDDSLLADIMKGMDLVFQQFVEVSQPREENCSSTMHWLLKPVNEPFHFSLYFSDDDIKIIQKAFQHHLESRNILTTVEALKSQMDYDNDYLEVFTNLYTEDDLKTDTIVSRTVAMCSQVLDAEDIFSWIKSIGMSCQFMTWCAVLNHFQKDVLKFITSESRETIRKLITDGRYPLPMLLNVMYLILRVSSVEGIDICLAIGENVSIRDVCFVIMKLQQHKIATEVTRPHMQRYCQNIFLSYITKLRESTPDLATQWINDKEVFAYSLAAFLNVNDTQDHVCGCGLPQPQTMRQAPLQFKQIGDVIMQQFREEDPNCYVTMCCELGLWRDVLKYKQQQGSKVADMLPYMVQLDSFEILAEWSHQFTEELWCELLQMKRSLDLSHCCLFCGKPLQQLKGSICLTWSHLGSVMIKEMGAEKTCDLLACYMPTEKPQALDARFYQACIFSSMASKYGEGPRQNIIDALQPSSSDPLQLFSYEVTGVISEAVSRDLALHGGAPSDLLPSSISKHHWGVVTKLHGGQCPCCSLSLTDPVLLSQSGVKVFKCGHSYHSVCYKHLGNNCLLCNSKES